MIVEKYFQYIEEIIMHNFDKSDILEQMQELMFTVQADIRAYGEERFLEGVEAGKQEAEPWVWLP